MTRRPPEALPSHPDLDIISAETGFDRHLRVDIVRFRHRLFSGQWSGECLYDVVRRGGAVAIVLYDPDRESVVLIEQFRLPALMGGCSPWQIEAVAGLVDHAAETTDAVAIREAKEEADIELIGAPLLIQRYLPSCGGSDECVSLYCGRVDARAAGGVHGLASEGEDTRILVKTLAEIEALIDAGAIENGHTLVALYWLLRHRDRLRRLWPPLATAPPS
jgi:ADP-ribose pyrophosphatase